MRAARRGRRLGEARAASSRVEVGRPGTIRQGAFAAAAAIPGSGCVAGAERVHARPAPAMPARLAAPGQKIRVAPAPAGPSAKVSAANPISGVPHSRHAVAANSTSVAAMAAATAAAAVSAGPAPRTPVVGGRGPLAKSRTLPHCCRLLYVRGRCDARPLGRTW